MTSDQVYTGLIADALAPIIRRAVHPETTYRETGMDVPKWLISTRQRRHETKEPLAPRDRLAARLALMVALTECKNQLMKEALADTESIEDAKKHKAAGL